jgi:hypothetical protein
MRGRSGAELLGLPVRLRGIGLGRPVDLIVDLDAGRAHGFDVLCGDDVHRFLPFAAVTPHDDELSVSSALTMLEERELAFYRDRATTLGALRGAELERGGKAVGRLRDVVVGEGGVVEGVVVEVDDAVRTLEPGDGLRPAAASAA